MIQYYCIECKFIIIKFFFSSLIVIHTFITKLYALIATLYYLNISFIDTLFVNFFFKHFFVIFETNKAYCLILIMNELYNLNSLQTELPIDFLRITMSFASQTYRWRYMLTEGEKERITSEYQLCFLVTYVVGLTLSDIDE